MNIRLLAVWLLVACTGARAGVLFLHEGFDDLAASGWTIVNASTPPGATSWFQGDPAIFPAFDGAPDAYAAADLDSRGAPDGTISAWLISPEIDFGSQELFFFARAAAVAGDGLNVMISGQGPSLDLADFSLLLALNPGNLPGGMPTDWTPFLAILPPAGASGRIAFEYTAGPNDVASYVGVDEVVVAPPVCFAGANCAPEPTSLPLVATALALAAIGVVRARRRALPASAS